jgi:hypothetical protein
MADHALVTWTLDRLTENYDPGNVATSTPVLVDDGTGAVYDLDPAADTRSEVNSRFDADPQQVNIVTVDPNPNRTEDPIGTEYDLRVKDGVGILVEGLATSEGGEVAGASELGELYGEVRRAVLDERTSYPSVGGVDYHTVVPSQASRTPEGQNSATYFARTFDLLFRGYEEL